MWTGYQHITRLHTLLHYESAYNACLSTGGGNLEYLEETQSTGRTHKLQGPGGGRNQTPDSVAVRQMC